MKYTTKIKQLSFFLLIVSAIALPVLNRFAVASLSSTSNQTPIELGRVQWHRSLKESIPLAKKMNRPIFILFQEVPGCFTCQNYEHKVLSHPLVVEGIESLFIPVAILNNRGGEDAQTLRKFGEPAWNNPVVRIVSINEKDLVPRLSGNYTISGLVNHMVQALIKAHKPIPEYLFLLQQELKAHQNDTEKSVFAMACFWSGEGALGNIDGVISTQPGFLHGHEVVEVEFDPTLLPYDQLIDKVKKQRVATQVFTHNDHQQKIASQVFGRAANPTKQTIRPDNQPKYYLSKTPLKYVPMTELQASRVNSAIGKSKNFKQFLSPRQLALLNLIQQHPNARWRNAIGTQNLTTAWQEALVIAQEVTES